MGNRARSAQVDPCISEKYCTYWMVSGWSGAKYTAVIGIPLFLIRSDQAVNSIGVSSSSIPDFFRLCWTVWIMVSKSTP